MEDADCGEGGMEDADPAEETSKWAVRDGDVGEARICWSWSLEPGAGTWSGRGCCEVEGGVRLGAGGGPCMVESRVRRVSRGLPLEVHRQHSAGARQHAADLSTPRVVGRAASRPMGSLYLGKLPPVGQRPK